MSRSNDQHREVRKTDAEWRAQLDPVQYRVARQAATEPAFIGKYWDHGPQPTGERFCINSAAIDFAPE